MPLSHPVSRSALKHTRTLKVEAYARDDKLWDIEAQITDIKTRVVPLASGDRPAGMPIHDLKLRLTINVNLDIIAVEAASDAVPYPGYCDTISPAYQAMVGLNLMRNFRRQLTLRLGGTAGCTHLTELAQILPTAAIQALSGEVIDTRDGSSAASDQPSQPFQLDRCHALRTDGAAVALYYPRWVAKIAEPFQSS
ncbi:DUF2889 domain-containing protein [Actimicrobium sp. CCI2.3]|uniref:DUF2889 domain-containing protein n=1 Tax=Actimicrobium sp. CCI2.3 TaxID=3048616 RepID=UPI002AB3377A|nr:DUF2889 domain-containing protein [Actimicrobium sp. CCI2.3]MDY7576085.1 DUF2889 domain-containing protein [Actimicrobium sp. CCI2.3]MEB0023015.1 DUF2889 domain-containing protein [Actimicrobium sp. CCI2.3]